MSMATFVSRGLIAGRMSAWVRRGMAPYVLVSEPPATGFQYFDAGTTGVTTQSLQYGAVPPVATGDIGSLSSATTPGGYTPVVGSDGIMRFASGADRSRQAVTYDFYSVAQGAWYGSKTTWVNNSAPRFTGADPTLIILPKATTITPVSLRQYFSDDDGDTVTVTLTTNPPGTLASDGEFLNGATPNANSITDTTARGADITGEYDDGAVRIVIGKVVAPSIVTTTVTDATALLLGANLTLGAQTTEANAAPAGQIIRQDPLANAEVDYGSAVNVVISSGPTSSGGGGTSAPPPTTLVTRTGTSLRSFLLG